MKKLLTYCGILSAFVFLLVINTNALSGKGCQDEIYCGLIDRWDFNNCYWTFSQPLEWGTCYNVGNKSWCLWFYEVHNCSYTGMKDCCEADPTRNCHVVKEGEGEEEIEEVEPPR